MDELLSSQSTVVSTRIFARRGISTSFGKARAAKNTSRYLVFCISILLLFLLGSGITFINSLLFIIFTRFYWGGVTGSSFINRSQTGVLGRQSGSPLLLTAYWRGNRDLVKISCLYQGRRYSHHLPETEGCFLGRCGEGGELVLVLL